ncbi:MAG: hypothetical protein HRU20_12465 [Pseudomonadales bacterium]|nr:hypothetical protein [Pseudomonadales bacterium]
MAYQDNKHSLFKTSLQAETLIFFHGPSHKKDHKTQTRSSDIKAMKRISARQLH